jgi:hypothetical protein
MKTDDFDWGSIAYETWMEFAAVAGADERHAKFAAAKFRKCTNTQAAREAGFGTGNDQSTRSEGYRVARSNKINQLLAMASAEAGGGYDGTLTRQESRSILTAMARGSDPNCRIKAIELLNKMDREEAEAKAAAPEETLEEMLASVIRSLPDGLGAVLAMSTFEKTAKNIVNFPFLKECAPVVAKNFPDQWQAWRDKNGPFRKWALEFLDRVAAGPVLDDAALDAAVSVKAPRRPNTEITADV